MFGKFEQVNEIARQYDTDEEIADWDPYVDDGRGYRFATPEEGWEMFDSEARYLMNMSGEEFLRRFDAGEFYELAGGHGEEHSRLMSVIHLIPFARQKR
ncbi:MAG: hypothetical protein H0V47_09295 [Chloroflexia bacterium]|jgi:hypothetical protein|nr:hypothetical protein [Chloroflexia bacterium]